MDQEKDVMYIAEVNVEEEERMLLRDQIQPRTRETSKIRSALVCNIQLLKRMICASSPHTFCVLVDTHYCNDSDENGTVASGRTVAAAPCFCSSRSLVDYS